MKVFIPVMIASIALTQCLGKTILRETNKNPLIPPKYHKIFIAYPINYTSQFELGIKIRESLVKYLDSQTRFKILKEEEFEETDLYLVLKINSFQFQPIYQSFNPTEVVNHRFSILIDILVQTKPTSSPLKKSTIYINENQMLIYHDYNLIEENFFHNYEATEKKFLNYLGREIAYLLQTGKRLPENKKQIDNQSTY